MVNSVTTLSLLWILEFETAPPPNEDIGYALD